MTDLIYFLVGCSLSFIGIYYSFKFRRIRRACFWVTTKDLFDEASLLEQDGFTISFRGLTVKKVRLHSLFFWNGGNSIITREEIPDGHDLRFSFPVGSQLAVEKISHTGGAFAPTVEIQGTNVKLGFTHIDAGDGIWIVVTEALKSIENISSPTFDGSMVENPEGFLRRPPKPASYTIRLFKFGFAFTIGLVSIFVIPIVLSDANIWTWPPSRIWLLPLALIVMLSVTSQLFGYTDVFQSKRYKVPKIYQEFWNNAKYRTIDPLFGDESF